MGAEEFPNDLIQLTAHHVYYQLLQKLLRYFAVEVQVS